MGTDKFALPPQFWQFYRWPLSRVTQSSMWSERLGLHLPLIMLRVQMHHLPTVCFSDKAPFSTRYPAKRGFRAAPSTPVNPYCLGVQCSWHKQKYSGPETTGRPVSFVSCSSTAIHFLREEYSETLLKVSPDKHRDFLSLLIFVTYRTCLLLNGLVNLSFQYPIMDISYPVLHQPKNYYRWPWIKVNVSNLNFKAYNAQWLIMVYRMNALYFQWINRSLWNNANSDYITP